MLYYCQHDENIKCRPVRKTLFRGDIIPYEFGMSLNSGHFHLIVILFIRFFQMIFRIFKKIPFSRFFSPISYEISYKRSMNFQFSAQLSINFQFFSWFLLFEFFWLAFYSANIDPWLSSTTCYHWKLQYSQSSPYTYTVAKPIVHVQNLSSFNYYHQAS